MAYKAWLGAGPDAWMLGAEASTVVAMQMTRMALGGEAGACETELMVSEKVRAGLDLQSSLVAEGTTLTPLRATEGLWHYRGKVIANRRRLSQ